MVCVSGFWAGVAVPVVGFLSAMGTVTVLLMVRELVTNT